MPVNMKAQKLQPLHRIQPLRRLSHRAQLPLAPPQARPCAASQSEEPPPSPPTSALQSLQSSIPSPWDRFHHLSTLQPKWLRIFSSPPDEPHHHPVPAHHILHRPQQLQRTLIIRRRNARLPKLLHHHRPRLVRHGLLPGMICVCTLAHQQVPHCQHRPAALDEAFPKQFA